MLLLTVAPNAQSLRFGVRPSGKLMHLQFPDLDSSSMDPLSITKAHVLSPGLLRGAVLHRHSSLHDEKDVILYPRRASESPSRTSAAE